MIYCCAISSAALPCLSFSAYKTPTHPSGPKPNVPGSLKSFWTSPHPHLPGRVPDYIFHAPILIFRFPGRVVILYRPRCNSHLYFSDSHCDNLEGRSSDVQTFTSSVSLALPSTGRAHNQSFFLGAFCHTCQAASAWPHEVLQNQEEGCGSFCLKCRSVRDL